MRLLKIAYNSLLCGTILIGLIPCQHAVAQTFTIIHEFDGTDGYHPYGLAYPGGTNKYGFLYEVNPTGAISTIYNFPEFHSFTLATPVRDPAGNFYISGSVNANTGIYRIGVNGLSRLLIEFTNAAEAPASPLTRDKAGNIYFTTIDLLSFHYGVSRLSPDGTVTVLASWSGDGGDFPYSGVILAPDGSLYGTAIEGGAYDYGTVYKIDALGNFTVVYNFQGGADGNWPYGRLTMDTDGNLCGTTSYGGASGDGTVYKIDTTVNKTILHSFNGNDGSNPYSPLLISPDGTIFSTNAGGGKTCSFRLTCGVIFRIQP
ncbi:MAG TPA: choice-of-anchor tandem repeat GloVer-containing protein [Terriglobales bacterium]|jgi:uncharacterized repeat protein (TIGR03803 family)